MVKVNLKCEILSPLHIGTGEEFDPFNYIIKDERLYRFSFERFLYNTDDATRLELEKLIDSGSFPEIRNYIAAQFDTDRYTVYSIAVTPKIAVFYRDNINNAENQLLIMPMSRTDVYSLPFVPGSSIKGAIRTAVISELAKEKKIPAPKNIKEEYSFESSVLKIRDAKEDPFRAIKIRDKNLYPDETIIREIKNVSKKGGELQANSISLNYETTHSLITGNPVIFETEMLINDSLQSTVFLRNKLELHKIIDACNSFYRDKMELEHKKFYQGNPMLESISNKLLKIALGDNSFLLRVGRFCGVECVTLDKYRKPKPPRNMRIWGTSRNLCEGIYPMGWLKVTCRQS